MSTDLAKTLGPRTTSDIAAVPDKDGLPFLRTIVMSSHEMPAIHAEARALGTDEIWDKPFNAAQVTVRVVELISQGRI